MLDKQRAEQYSKFKEILSNQTTNTDQISVSDTSRDQILDRARLFINRIKEHRHDKIKARQQNKFEQLFFKIHGCHNNLSRHHQVFDNINPNSNNLGSQPNVPTSSSPRHSTPSNNSTSATTTANNQPTTANPSNTNNPSKAMDHMFKWVINLSRAPLTNDQLSLLQKGPNFAITPKYPPLDAYITATEVAATILNTQEAEEFRSDVSRLLKQHQQQTQCNLNPAQCRALT